MRSLRMAGLLALLGVGLVIIVIQILTTQPMPASAPCLVPGCAWFALDFLLLALAYLMAWPRLLGKNRTGGFPFWSLVLFFPYRLYAQAIWNLARVTSHEPAFNQVNPGLIIGRRLLPFEPRPHFDTLIDLTCEIDEWATFSLLPGYRYFPILDAAAPIPEALHEAVRMIHPGPVYVHCAQGHGRTGLFAAALLLHRREAATSEEALAMLKQARPGIALNDLQMTCLRRYEERIRSA